MVVAGLAACSPDIWNAGDLTDWVRDQAVARGCLRETIELEDWYRSEDGRNTWHGRCETADGARRNFAIGVDEVWTPSSESG